MSNISQGKAKRNLSRITTVKLVDKQTGGDDHKKLNMNEACEAVHHEVQQSLQLYLA